MNWTVLVDGFFGLMSALSGLFLLYGAALAIACMLHRESASRIREVAIQPTPEPQPQPNGG